MSKISLPSIPRSADRDTTVFFQSLKKAIERLQVGDQSELSESAKSYVLRIDKNTREDLVGVIGDESSVGAILDKIKGQITESELSISLGQRIEKITSNENAITEERLQRVADVLAANQAIIDEAAARVQAITDSSNLLQQGIDAEVTARVNAISTTRDEIIAERNLRVADVLAANTKIEQEATTRLQAVTATNTALEGETRDRIAAILEANRDITTEREARVAAIIDESSQRTTNEAIVAERLSGVFAQVNPKLAGDTDGWAGDTASYVGVWSEQSARIEKDFALGTRIDTLNAEFSNSNALIQTNYKVLAEADKALAMRTDIISVRTDGNTAAINTESQARTDDVSAISGRIDTLSAVTNGNTASITSESTARTTEDAALSSRIETLVATTGTNSAAIQTEVTARTTQDTALSGRIDTLTATTGDNAAAIQIESTARTDADGALSGRIDTLVATTGNNTASITSEVLARTTEDQALSQRITTLVSTTGTNSAAIQTETQARTTADSALSSRVDTLVSTTGANTASIQSNYNALTTATSANASRIDGVYAQVNPKMAGDTDGWAGDDSPQNLVGVWSERSAIIENDLAMSKRVDGLTTEVGNNKATITEVNKTLVTKNEVVASQINRLAAQMVGGYDGNNLQDITSGLIHQERQARTTETEGLAQQISLLSAGVGEQFDSFEIWHFNKNNDGWTGGVYQDGWLNVKAEALTSPTITLDGSMYKHVKIRIQKFGTPTWQGLLSYAGGSITALEPSYTEDGIALVNFYAQWTTSITSFSLKLASVADATNYFLVDWVAVGRPSPGASHAALLREEKARADKDLAIVQDVTALNVQINGDDVNSSSSIVQKLTTTASKTDANASDISGLTSTFNNEMYGAEGIVTRNAQTAASASTANARDISGVFAQVNPRMAGDTNRWAGDNDPLNLVGVWSERSARIEAGVFTAERFDAMTARVDGNAAAISTETKIRVDAISSLAQRTDTIRADFDANAIDTQGKITAAQGRLDTVEQDAASALSSLVDISADNKLTPVEKNQITVILNEIKKSDAGIRERATKYGLSLSVYNVAYVSLNNYLAPIMASLSETSDIVRTTFDTRFADLYAKRTELETAIVNAIKSEATSLSGNAAVMQTKITTVADANTALSERTDTIQSTVGANTSSIQTAQESINGINASWSIKADVNGVVGGLGVVNDGRTVDFIMRASSFAIQGPSGSNSVPFVVYPDGATIGGVYVPPGVFIDTAFIRRGSFDSLSALSANIGHFKSAATGRRLEIKDGLVSVYDDSNTLRVRLGLW